MTSDIRHRTIVKDLEDYFEDLESDSLPEVVGYLKERNVTYQVGEIKNSLKLLESEGSIAIIESENNDYIVKYLEGDA